MAALTNGHTLRHIYSDSVGLEVSKSVSLHPSQELAGPPPSRGFRGESVPCLRNSSSLLVPWLNGHVAPVPASPVTLSSLLWSDLPLPPPSKDACHHFQGPPRLSRIFFLHHICQDSFVLRWRVLDSPWQLPKIQTWCFGGVVIQPNGLPRWLMA